VHGVLPPLNVSGLPPDLEAVLRRALSKKQGDRFPTISAFARAFGAATTPSPVAAATPRPVRAPTPPALERLGTMFGSMLPKRKRRRPGLVDMTLAIGKRAVEDFLPQRRKPPRRTWAWISAGALGVSLAVGALLLFRPLPKATPAVIKVEAPPDAPTPAPVKVTPAHRERKRH
jgi:hypothetical protein